MSKRNCLGCGQFADRYHRCPAKGQVRVPSTLKPYRNTEGTTLEPRVLFANKSTLITLLPDGSLLKTKTNKDGVETVTEAGRLIRLLFASQISKAKLNLPVEEVKKDKVEKAWESYIENDDAYTQKNKEVDAIAAHIKQCKELIIETDASADKLLESSKARYQSIVDKTSAEVKRTYSEYQKVVNDNPFVAAEALIEYEKARLFEKNTVDTANKMMDDVILKVHALKSVPRDVLAKLEAELKTVNTPPEQKVTNPLDLLENQ